MVGYAKTCYDMQYYPAYDLESISCHNNGASSQLMTTRGRFTRDKLGQVLGNVKLRHDMLGHELLFSSFSSS